MERYTEVCGDNRFELIEKYKEKLVKATNIETSKEEMDVIDNILFRFWQMGWLDKLEEDVVPRSEYEAVVSAVDNSTKEFLKLHDAYQNQKREYEAELNKAKQESTDFYCSFTQSKIQNCPIQDEIAKAKQEVARELLNEIKTKVNSLIDFYRHHTTVLSTVRAKVDAYFEIDDFIAELEKKYIGRDTNVPTKIGE